MAAKKPVYVGPAWTKAQRAALHGARRPHPLDPPPVPTTREQAWQAVVREAAAREAASGAVLTSGPEAQALLAPLLRSLTSGTAPGEGELDTVTEQLRAHLVMNPEHGGQPTDGLVALVAFWAETAGIEWLFELARARHQYSLGSSGSSRHFSGKDYQASSPSRGLGVFEYPQVRIAVRRYFFALPDGAFATQSAALERACLQTFSRVDERYRDATTEAAWLAFVLGRDGTRAHALVEKSREKDGRIGYVTEAGQLLASVTDLGLATELIDGIARVMVFHGADYALDFVETFGRDAAPLLEKILATTVGQKPKVKPYYTGRFSAAIKLANTAP